MTPRTVDDAVSVRDVSLGINDWYNVTPSIRRAIEGFAVILKDHTAHLERLDRAMAAGPKNGGMQTTPVSEGGRLQGYHGGWLTPLSYIYAHVPRATHTRVVVRCILTNVEPSTPNTPEWDVFCCLPEQNVTFNFGIFTYLHRDCAS